jgi:hypothetical protein
MHRPEHRRRCVRFPIGNKSPLGSRLTVRLAAESTDRLRINDDGWLETVRDFGRWFKRAVGRADSLASAALRTGRRWYQGQRAARIAFH